MLNDALICFSDVNVEGIGCVSVLDVGVGRCGVSVILWSLFIRVQFFRLLLKDSVERDMLMSLDSIC